MLHVLDTPAARTGGHDHAVGTGAGAADADVVGASQRPSLSATRVSWQRSEAFVRLVLRLGFASFDLGHDAAHAALDRTAPTRPPTAPHHVSTFGTGQSLVSKN